jgi:hypothetical protein
MVKIWTISYSRYSLWLSPTLSLNTIKIKLSIDFFCLSCLNYAASPIMPFHDLTVIVLVDLQSLFQLTLLRLLSLLLEFQLSPCFKGSNVRGYCTTLTYKLFVLEFA